MWLNKKPAIRKHEKFIILCQEVSTSATYQSAFLIPRADKYKLITELGDKMY